MFRNLFPLIAGLMFILTSCNVKSFEPVRETILLDGTWRFAMSDLRSVLDKPEARQLYSSILKYMSSGKFNPSQSLSPVELSALFSTRVLSKKMTGVVNLSY
jgi:hypothetical protein